jgi:Dihaem cytochrome c
MHGHAALLAALLVSLDEHFGENASLDGPTVCPLAAWLVDHAAETFDTESANRFRVVAPEAPYRITSTPYWVRKHASVPPEVFRRRSVQSRVNCHACHRAAASGRFDDQAIALPEEHSP